MTENTPKIAKKNGTSRRIVSILLFIAVAALLISSVLGYAVRGMASTQTILDTMRTDAVLSTATSGLVDSIAAARRLAYSQELRKSKDFRKMGTDAYIEACNKAEEEARAEATALYSDTTGVDTVALEAAIPGIQGIQTQYNAMKEAENEVYAALYAAVVESVDQYGGALRQRPSASRHDQAGQRHGGSRSRCRPRPGGQPALVQRLHRGGGLDGLCRSG